ncbi:ubiquinol oxidase subunit II [Alcanivorax sp. S6407]|uniref:ubiquinol oxidase subunit II n=1 Tax=Alcanivorax sp. S6407 TaxID=2926424 RepID=UPI001FF4ED3B|nr:ubiquinol oxidase subunit II [Alcanivorax sp. S6407]MCK0153349.1 ubiquinol oxidase subunit II [Alcanivorax sp. S6407]
MQIAKFLRGVVLTLLAAALLTGCDTVVMSPSGDIAMQQRDLLVWATILMLLVIVPVIVLTLWFAWRYRETNEDATYAPEWTHSTVLELVIWSVPLLIIIALGAMTWVGTHKLDPYRPLERIDAQTPVPADLEPLTVEVVALDWKWLFIYPEQGIATVNELAAPVDHPIRFKITASTMMNSFFIPALAGQIYAMAGMETKLHGVINEPGVYKGFSANYSGAGYSHMKFDFHGLSEADFDAWVAKVKASELSLDRDTYLELEVPSAKVPVMLYADVDPTLYHGILNRCVAPGTVCMEDMMYHSGMGQHGGHHGEAEAGHEGHESHTGHGEHGGHHD